jgi:hypothetical protein
MGTSLIVVGIVVLAGALLCLVAVLCAPSLDEMDTERL